MPSYYLSAAIWPKRRNHDWMPKDVGNFNDRCKSFERIRAVIMKTRALAQRDTERLPEIIAAVDAAYAAEKKFIAQARKRLGLDEELERAASMISTT